MRDYTINVSRIEELQTLKDTDELEKIFTRAKSAIVNGEKAILARKTKSGTENFDELSTLEDLQQYRKQVFKYLK
ncbi:MAG: hypothetical protein ACJ75F_08560 [Flavisolibacter sp.]